MIPIDLQSFLSWKFFQFSFKGALFFLVEISYLGSIIRYLFKIISSIFFLFFNLSGSRKKKNKNINFH